MSSGWISLHRSILESPFWVKEKFTRGQAWVDLILNANHKEKKVILKGNLITVMRGQQIRSKVTLVKTWKWNERTVTRFLNMLELDGMITQKSTNQTTYITICNYNKFQDRKEKSTDQSTDQSTRRVQTRVQTNNNDNNGNKGNKDQKTARFAPPSIAELQNYITEKNLGTVNAEIFFNHYEQNGWKVGKNKMKSWKLAVSGWHKRNLESGGNNEKNKSTSNRRLSAVERVEQATARGKAERDAAGR